MNITDLQAEEKILIDLKRNIKLHTATDAVFISGYADIKAKDLRDCKLRDVLIEAQEETNKLLGPYAYRVFRDILKEKIGALSTKHSAAVEDLFQDDSPRTQLLKDFEALNTVLNLPMSETEAAELTDGWIKADDGLSKFDHLEPELPPPFLTGDVSFTDTGKPIIIRP